MFLISKNNLRDYPEDRIERYHQSHNHLMATKSATHRSLGSRVPSIVWDQNSPLSMQIDTRKGEISTRHGRFSGGAADQVEVIEVDTGAIRVMILPTRGMSIWRMEASGARLVGNLRSLAPCTPLRFQYSIPVELAG